MGFFAVGDLNRREVDRVVVAYEFDLRNNALRTVTAPNPSAGREHKFIAYRVIGDLPEQVTLESKESVVRQIEEAIKDEK